MEPSNQPSNNRFQIIGVVAVVALLVFALTAYAANQRGLQTASTAISSPAPSSSPVASVAGDAATPTPAAAGSYKNGSYSATGHYQSPGGAQSIQVTLTITGDTVTAAQATSGAIDSESAEYQGKFIGGFQAQVVGHSLDSLHLSRVSGSSLTPGGFNDAVDQIKAQAKA